MHGRLVLIRLPEFRTQKPKITSKNKSSSKTKSLNQIIKSPRKNIYEFKESPPLFSSKTGTPIKLKPLVTTSFCLKTPDSSPEKLKLRKKLTKRSKTKEIKNYLRIKNNNDKTNDLSNIIFDTSLTKSIEFVPFYNKVNQLTSPSARSINKKSMSSLKKLNDYKYSINFTNISNPFTRLPTFKLNSINLPDTEEIARKRGKTQQK